MKLANIRIFSRKCVKETTNRSSVTSECHHNQFHHIGPGLYHGLFHLLFRRIQLDDYQYLQLHRLSVTAHVIGQTYTVRVNVKNMIRSYCYGTVVYGAYTACAEERIFSRNYGR